MYWSIFAIAALLAASLEWANRRGKSSAATPNEFRLFRNNYLVVYSLMMGAWVGAAPGCDRQRVSPPPAACR